MEELVSEFDLIQAISGTDEFGNGKCTVSLQPQRCNAEGVVINTDDEYITEKPVVQLFRQAGGYFLLDLMFDSVEDLDLHRMYGYFQDFFAATNSASDDEMDFPLLTLTILPNSLGGRYFAIGLNPIFYALTPEDTTGEPRILRLIFVSDPDPDALPNFLFLKSDETELENILAEDGDEDDEDDAVSAV